MTESPHSVGRDLGDEGDDAPSLVGVTQRRTPPTTARGARTRAALVAAARTVFERDGYLDARLADITTEAGLSVGSFYTYFESKEEILGAVIEAAQDDMLHPGMPRLRDEESTPEAVIRASNRAYFEAYRRNAQLMLILDQVAAVDPRFREVRRRRSSAFARRNAAAIASLQGQGLVDPALDPYPTAQALSSMVGRMAYHCYCLGEEIPLEQLVDVCTRLWVNALQLRSEAPEGTSSRTAGRKES